MTATQAPFSESGLSVPTKPENGERPTRADREVGRAGRRTARRGHAQRPRRGPRGHGRLNRRGGRHREARGGPVELTAVAPVKFVPLIVTLVPAGPLAGVKLVIVGGDDHSGTHSRCSPSSAGSARRR